MRSRLAGLMIVCAVSSPLIARTSGCRTILTVTSDGTTHEQAGTRCRGSIHDDQESTRVPAGQPIVIRVPLNTALFEMTSKSKPVDAPEIADLNALFALLKPYATDLLTTQGWSPHEKSTTPSVIQSDIDAVATLVYGRGGLWDTRMLVLASLLEMSRPESSSAAAPGSTFVNREREELKKSLRAFPGDRVLVLPNQPDPPLPACGNDVYVLTLPASLTKALRQLASHVADPDAARDPALDDGRQLLDGSEKLLTAAHRLDDLTRIATTACSVWQSDPFEVTMAKGLELTFTPAVRDLPEIRRIAGEAPEAVTLTVLPDWTVRPAAGVALGFSPRSTFPTYATKKSGDQVVIVPKGHDDHRADYLFTLGLTYPILDGRAKASHLTWWLPELMVNPSDKVRSLGIGTSVSWKFLKIGIGALWSKHDVLDGQLPGQLLDSAGDLATCGSYGAPKSVFTISIIGWQPFANP